MTGPRFALADALGDVCAIGLMLVVIVLLRRIGVPTLTAEIAAAVLVVPPWFWVSGRLLRIYDRALRAHPENRAVLDAVSAGLVVVGLLGAAIFQVGYLGGSAQLRYVGLGIAGAGWITFFLRQPARPRGSSRGRQV